MAEAMEVVVKEVAETVAETVVERVAAAMAEVTEAPRSPHQRSSAQRDAPSKDHTGNLQYMHHWQRRASPV